MQVANELPSQPAHWTVTYREYYTGCCNNTICPQDDEHRVARNMLRIIIINVLYNVIVHQVGRLRRIVLENLTADQLVKKFPGVYKTKIHYSFTKDHTMRKQNTVHTITPYGFADSLEFGRNISTIYVTHFILHKHNSIPLSVTSTVCFLPQRYVRLT